MAAKIFMDLPGGLKMPAIGLGTGQLRADDEETLNSALKLGYRHIDTAYAYQNEKVIGRVLQQWFSSGNLKREDVFITTKLPMQGVHEDRVEMFMNKSLENLQLDYVDLYLVHFPIGVKYNEEEESDDVWSNLEIDTFDHIAIWRKMEEQVDAGRVKAIGLSNFNQKQIERILKAARIKPSCLQIELHVDFQQPDVVKFCQTNNIIPIAYSPLGSPGHSVEPKPGSLPAILYNETIKNIAEKHQKTSAQVMLRYLVQKNIVAIPHSSKPKRQKENIDVFDFSLDAEDMDKMFELDVGESGRMAWFKFIPGIEDHPEYPFKK